MPGQFVSHAQGDTEGLGHVCRCLHGHSSDATAEPHGGPPHGAELSGSRKRFSVSLSHRPSESEPAPDPRPRRAGLHAQGASVTMGRRCKAEGIVW